ncbi:hypothetical protein [Methylosinus sp. Sm6]|uniref:hypothetical protein n=1 Tax=Methylosinus sp. Sm6 TaxID=2866948 RepID=UPI001C9934EE|nr:hypothetical protein [Methylosinus sp. Sm6]MBY6239889.1 hypothetical protein [Methylosinus sp. Sm6]
MDELALLLRRIARVVIAGLFAWGLIAQSVAAATATGGSAHAGVMSAEQAFCAERGDHRPHGPERHLPCSSSCCLSCRSAQLGDLTLHLAFPVASESVSFPAADGLEAEHFLVVEAGPPPGWIGSWSQRAPPRC